MKTKIKDITSIICNIALDVGVVLFLILFLQEIILNYKVTKQDDCIKLNDNYYCRIDKEK